MVHDSVKTVLDIDADGLSLVLGRRRPLGAGPRVLEVSQVWSGTVLDTRHFRPGVAALVGSSTARRRADFFGDDDVLVVWMDGAPWVHIADKADGFVEIGDERRPLSAVPGRVADDGGRWVEVSPERRVVVTQGGVTFVTHQVDAASALQGGREPADRPFQGMLALAAMIGLSFAALTAAAPPQVSNELVEVPDRFLHLALDSQPPEVKAAPSAKKDQQPEGAKPKRDEGRVGKKDARMKTARGERMERSREDRQIAEHAGVMGALASGGALEGLFGSNNLDATISDAVGGLVGAKGAQIGAGGLGSRGSSLGGGGTSDRLDGTGTKGFGGGDDGFGAEGGAFGTKKDGGNLAYGDPIVLGALDKALIDEVVKRHMSQIKYCYQRELTRDANLVGKIVTKFTIAGDGSVGSSSVKASTMGSAAVEQCVASKFLKMTFPKPKGGGVVVVSYPFVFGT
jgi:hypothetical protein